MNAQMKLLDQIERAKSELKTLRPRAHRRVELEARLKMLTTKLLRSEIRIEKRKAA